MPTVNDTSASGNDPFRPFSLRLKSAQFRFKDIVAGTNDKVTRLLASIIGGALVAGLVLLALAGIYGPETRNLVFGGPMERHDGPSAEDMLKAVSECSRDREWQQNQFIKQHGELDIPVEPVWTFVADEEATYELWRQRQSPVGFQRLRAARIDLQRLSDTISETGNVFGAEIFPDRRYLFTVGRTRQSTIDTETLVSATGVLAGPSGATGEWSMTVNARSGETIGTIDGSDSWISIRVGIEDRSLAVFAEIDQCSRQQQLRDISF